MQQNKTETLNLITQKIFQHGFLRILNSTLPPPQLCGVEMPILYKIDDLLVDTVVNIINIIIKYDSTILIYFCFLFIYLYTTPQACSFNFNHV